MVDNLDVMQQHIACARKLLAKYDAPYALVLSHEIGYGLCEIARE